MAYTRISLSLGTETPEASRRIPMGRAASADGVEDSHRQVRCSGVGAHRNTPRVNSTGRLYGGSNQAGAHRWSDAEGVIEYGEWCLPPRFTIGYEYQP